MSAFLDTTKSISQANVFHHHKVGSHIHCCYTVPAAKTKFLLQNNSAMMQDTVMHVITVDTRPHKSCNHKQIIAARGTIHGN